LAPPQAVSMPQSIAPARPRANTFLIDLFFMKLNLHFIFESGFRRINFEGRAFRSRANIFLPPALDMYSAGCENIRAALRPLSRFPVLTRLAKWIFPTKR